jgi:hypothetical protein
LDSAHFTKQEGEILSVVRVPGCSVCKKPYNWYDANVKYKKRGHFMCNNHPYVLDILVEVETK